MPHAIELRRLTADGIAIPWPATLYGLAGRGTAAGSIATVYLALQADTNRQLATLTAPANQWVQLAFWPGLHVEAGLYVDLASNGLEVLVAFERADAPGG